MYCQCTFANVHHANKFLEKLEGNDFKVSMETNVFILAFNFVISNFLRIFSNYFCN
jgi:hypothetical protein